MEKIKILVLDVDGTLTDGKLYIDDHNNSFKAFSVKDGFAISNWINLGGKVCILTGKKSNIVIRRAEELGIQYIIQNSKNKSKDLKKLLGDIGLSFENVAYIGDDINDIAVMKKVALSACPSDAVDEVIKIAKFKSKKFGGDGAVREVLEYIMKENGMWKKVLDKYLNETT